MQLAYYARIWFTAARYSVMRTLMFRGDFFIWALVELFWMTVNLLMISVIYAHTDSVAGWTKYQMMLLVGTSPGARLLRVGKDPKGVLLKELEGDELRALALTRQGLVAAVNTDSSHSNRSRDRPEMET